MPLYRIANLLVDSAIPLPAAPAPGRRAGVWKLRVDRRGRAPNGNGWYHREYSAPGRPWRSLMRAGSAQVIRFGRRGSFAVEFDARSIICYPSAHTSSETVRQLVLGHVLPLVFADRGALVLHASAVRTPHGAVAFVGETGSGKSTIAAALAARGHALAADDCAIVELAAGTCRVRPMHVGLRLWPDAVRLLAPHRRDSGPRAAARGKARLDPAALGLAVCGRPAPLHRVYLLDPPRRGNVAIAAVSRADAVIALLAASFELEMDRPAQLRRWFAKLGALAAGVTVRRLSRPRGLSHLPALVDAVLDDAAR